jgi:inactivated superfamily I helicase
VPRISDTDPQALKRKLGGYVRRGNSQAADETRRELKAARLAAAIKREVDSAPPLSAAQRDRLAALLRAPAARHDGEATLSLPSRGASSI